jgi:O-methyltransferase
VSAYVAGDDPGALAPSPAAEREEIARLRSRYIDLLVRALAHMLYRPFDIRWDENPEPDDYSGSDELREAAAKEFAREDFDWASVRADGRDWPQYAQTMVGLKRLANVRDCVERVIADDVPGDLIETGVWRGGVVILMRAILDAYDDRERIVFAADSFRGVPPPNNDAYPSDAGSRLHTAKALAVPREDVERNFDLYGLFDERVQILEGWFKDSLPAVKDRTWSVVRLDGDLYESTMDALTNLYPGLSVGGFLIVDDYGHGPCRQAVTDFRDAHGIDEPIEPIDWLGAFWRRAH